MDKQHDNTHDGNSAGQPEPGAGQAGAADGAAAGSNPAASAGRTGENAAAFSGLPSIDSPKLDGSAGESGDQFRAGATSQGESARTAAGAGPEASGWPLIRVDSVSSEQSTEVPPKSGPSRFAMLIATTALASGAGSFLAALCVLAFVHHGAAPAATSRTANAGDIVHALRAQVVELSAVRSNLEAATRSTNGQFSKIATRLDSLERAQNNPSAELQRLAAAVDRLEKQSAAAPEITGSIGHAAPAVSAPSPQATAVSNHVLPGWIVEEVHNGRALVASRYGGEFLVGTGTMLPGVGRVETVKRQDGQWIVLTESGTIASRR